MIVSPTPNENVAGSDVKIAGRGQVMALTRLKPVQQPLEGRRNHSHSVEFDVVGCKETDVAS